MRTDNTMAKRVIRRRKSNEDRQYNGQKSNQKT
jgi:hypothetical protein